MSCLEQASSKHCSINGTTELRLSLRHDSTCSSRLQRAISERAILSPCYDALGEHTLRSHSLHRGAPEEPATEGENCSEGDGWPLGSFIDDTSSSKFGRGPNISAWNRSLTKVSHPFICTQSVARAWESLRRTFVGPEV